jgi:hypothetical protein
MHVHENFGDHEKQFRFRKERETISAGLDRNHTHFILVDDETEGIFGGETECRMAFEMAVQGMQGLALRVKEEVSRILLDKELGWQGMRLPKKGALASRRCYPDRGDHDADPKNNVTAVCVCVQGGATTIRKVFESVLNGTPVVLVRGSGKVADLLADAIQYYTQVQSRAKFSGGGLDEFERASSASTDQGSQYSSENTSTSGRHETEVPMPKP